MNNYSIRRYLSILLTAVIMVNTFFIAVEVSSNTAVAATDVNIYEYTTLKSCRIKEYTGNYKNDGKIMEYVTDNVLNNSNANVLQNAVALPSSLRSIDYDDFCLLSYYISMVHPDMFFTEIRSWDTKNDNTTEFVKLYDTDLTQRNTRRSNFEKMVQIYLSKITGTTDSNKADALYSYMKSKVKYCNLKNNSQTDNQIVYNAMVNNSGNALSYARIFSYVLARAHIQNTLDTDACTVTLPSGEKYEWINEKQAELTKTERLNLYNSNADMISMYQPFYDKYKALIEKVSKAAACYDNSVSVTEFDMSQFSGSYVSRYGSTPTYSLTPSSPLTMSDTLDSIVKNLHPEVGFYLDRVKYNSGSKTVTLKYYNYPHKVIDEMRLRFNAKAKEYIGKVGSVKTDFEKALILHDEICSNVLYCGTNDVVNQNLVYTTMIEGYGICHSYSKVYSYLLSKVGVYSEIVKIQGHQLNKVRVDGQYYVVDLTGDDDKFLNTVKYKYFLISEKKWSSLIGDSYKKRMTYMPSDTKYDNYYYHNANRRMVLAGGNLYFIDNNADSENCDPKACYYLLRYNWKKNTKYVTKAYVDHNWKSENNLNYIECFSTPYLYGGLIYFNTVDCIYTFNIYSYEVKKYTSNNFSDYKQIFGIVVKGNKLYGLLQNKWDAPHFVARFITTCKKSDHDSFELTVPEKLSMYKGTQTTLKATVKPESLGDKKVTWKSDDSSIASIDANGVVTTKKAGITKVTATKTVEGKTLSASCTVTVNELPKVSGLTVSAKTLNSLTVKWDKLDVADSYRVGIKEAQNGAQYMYNYVNSNTSQFSGLTAGSKYTLIITPYTTVSGSNYYGNSSTISGTTVTYINTCSVTLEKTSYDYTGKDIKPVISCVKDKNGNTLKQGTDFTVSYSSNKYVGTGTITLTGKGGYTGTKTVQFAIKANIGKVQNIKTVSKTSTQIKLKWDSVKYANGYYCYITDNKSTYKKTKCFNATEYTFDVPKKSSYTFKICAYIYRNNGSHIQGVQTSYTVNN